MGRGKGQGDGYTTIAPPPRPLPALPAPSAREPAPFACGFHAHSDKSVSSLSYAVSSSNLQSESQKKWFDFQNHLGSTLFNTDQDTWNTDLWRVISKLLEEKKIDVFGCRTKANRWVQVVCKACGQYAHADYGEDKRAEEHTKEEGRQEGRNRIYRFLKLPVPSGKPTV